MNPSSPEPFVRAKSTQVGRRVHKLLMASHGDRLPRLTLKAGRRVGCKVGCTCRAIAVAQRTRRPLVRGNAQGVSRVNLCQDL